LLAVAVVFVAVVSVAVGVLVSPDVVLVSAAVSTPVVVGCPSPD
jgi:hypothetical protein